MEKIEQTKKGEQETESGNLLKIKKTKADDIKEPPRYIIEHG